MIVLTGWDSAPVLRSLRAAHPETDEELQLRPIEGSAMVWLAGYHTLTGLIRIPLT
jgi:hypothetical protein